MNPGVVTCAPETPLWTIARMMSDHRVHCVAVAGVKRTDAGSQRLAWGLIGDIDLVVAAHARALDASAIAIAATSPLAINEEESLQRAATLMADQDASHVVVVGPNGLPSGMLSTLDVAALVSRGSQR
jgi:CBS domain-containing protein